MTFLDVASNQDIETTVATSDSKPCRHGFPHFQHPSVKYLTNWKLEQAGSGWLGIGNFFGNSAVLIKRKQVDLTFQINSILQPTFHPNVIGLVEAFLENDNFYFVYNFHGFAVDLAQVATTPTVRMTEPDLASICRSILRGLEYIHNQLEISHGNITRSNILLYENGGIKIANIGYSMVHGSSQQSLEIDRQNVGVILIEMSDSHAILHPRRMHNPKNLSKFAKHFISQIETASYSYLFEHSFLQQANGESRTWYLMTHYLDAIACWGISTEHTDNPFE